MPSALIALNLKSAMASVDVWQLLLAKVMERQLLMVIVSVMQHQIITVKLEHAYSAVAMVKS